MSEQPLEDLFSRLERERLDADRVYNEALTALDRAIHAPPALPDPPKSAQPPPPTAGGLSAPTAKGGLVGGIRAVLWRILGSPSGMGQRFHAALAEHAAWSDAACSELRQTVAALVEASRSEFNALTQFESLLSQYLQTITLYVDTKDRGIGGSGLRDRLALVEQRLMAIKRELETPSEEQTGGKPDGQPDDQKDGQSLPPRTGSPASAEAFARNVDSTSYVGFEDRFRGAREDIRRRVEDYVPLLATSSDIVDVGCGRGELLDALRDRGVSARGVDANHAMVELCRARGLAVEQSDALTYLGRQPDGGVGGLVAVQVVEHFTPGYLARFLEAAYHKMRPGAPLILETINPACWMAFFETYIRDLTHQRPLHPDTLRYLVEATGFTGVDVQFRQPVTEGDRLDRVVMSAAGDAGALRADLARVAEALNAHADKLNARLFSSMDYVVIARR